MNDAIKLFFIFFKIGLFTFGGGYSTIPMVTQDMIKYGYLNQDQIAEFIGISESTPGPFAINLATFAGYEASGFLGALFATLGIVLPSFIIILLIAYLSKKFIDKPVVKYVFEFLKPVIASLIAAAFINVFIQTLNIEISPKIKINFRELIIFVTVLVITILFRKKMSPVKLVLLSAVLGIIVFLF